MIEPFLKWAGGKRWLVHGYDHLFPRNFKRYIEPFLGGGAVFFHLRPSIALLSDANEELINAYLCVKSYPVKIDADLKKLHERHCERQYYDIRDKRSRDPVERAVRFIYLNRACFNGLYRVNRNGDFNVPVGSKTTIAYPPNYLVRISEALSNVTLEVADFETILHEAGEGDFVFLDPPYTVMHNKNNFNKYNSSLFSWQDQMRLSASVKRAALRGALIMVTNADHAAVRALYSNLGDLRSVKRSSVLSGNARYRRQTTELLVRNYCEDN